MKILIASDLYWPTINGVSTFSRNLAKGLVAHGHQVLVVAPSQKIGEKYKEVDDGYTIVRTTSVPFPFYQNFRISLTPNLEVKKAICEFQPDVIHVQVMLMIGQAVMHYGHKFNIPIVSTNHTIPENLLDNLKLLAPVSRPINYALEKYIVRFHAKADYVTMPTQAAIDLFDLSSFRDDIPVEPVSNGIDLKRFTTTASSPEIIKKFNLPTDVPIITYVGRLDAEKHLPVLLKAFKRVLLATKAHLLIVGGGVESSNLKKIADELGVLDKVTFTGRVSDNDMTQLHKVGTVFCMPSPAELQSIATLEAMASGKPIVAVDAGALRELCQDKRNGLLCQPDDDREIAKSLIKILKDDDLRQSMSQESLKIAETHDLENTIKRFENIYQGLIDKKVKNL